MPLCFAYGSNMDRAAMLARCPASHPVGRARLARHRLALMREGYLTVVADPRREIHGLLWDIAFADMTALDRYEGVGEGLYVKRLRSVLTEAGPRRALVYVGRNAGPGEPRAGYIEAVLAAAAAAGLPAACLRDIGAFIPPGVDRALQMPRIRARRRSPLDPERDPSAGWRWSP